MISNNVIASNHSYNQVCILKGVENYQVWLFRIRLAMKKRKLWDIPTDQPTDNDDANDFLLANLSEEILQSMCTQGNDVNDVWDGIQGVLFKSALSYKAYVLKDLCQFKFSEYPHKDFHEFEKLLVKVKGCFNERKSISFDQLGAILAATGQSRSYNPITLPLLNEDDVDLHSVKTAICNASEAIEMQNQGQVGAALISKDVYKHRPGSSTPPAPCEHYKNKSKCYVCSPENRPTYVSVCQVCLDNKEPRFLHVYGSEKCNSKDGLAALVGFTGADEWVVDSGATDHLTNNKEDIDAYPYCKLINTANGDTMEVKERGIIHFTSGENIPETLSNVLICPEIQANLLSVYNLCIETPGNYVIFTADEIIVKNAKGETIMRGKQKNRLYTLTIKRVPQNTETTSCVFVATDTIENWHKRFNHLNVADLQHMARHNLVNGLKIKGNDNTLSCAPCIIGTTPQPRRIGELIHIDLSGEISPTTYDGYKYYIAATDDKSKYVWIRLMKHKSDALDFIEQLDMYIFNHTQRHISIIRSDNEFDTNNRYTNFCLKHGIQKQLTEIYTPQQNGVSERLNLTLLNPLRSNFAQSQLSPRLWGEALESVVYTRNRSPCNRDRSKTPFEIWYGKRPDVSHLRAFGEKVYVHIHSQHRPSGKLSARAKEAYIMGYSKTRKAYRLLDPTTNQVIESREVTFLITKHTNAGTQTEQTTASTHEVSPATTVSSIVPHEVSPATTVPSIVPLNSVGDIMVNSISSIVPANPQTTASTHEVSPATTVSSIVPLDSVGDIMENSISSIVPANTTDPIHPVKQVGETPVSIMNITGIINKAEQVGEALTVPTETEQITELSANSSEHFESVGDISSDLASNQSSMESLDSNVDSSSDYNPNISDETPTHSNTITPSESVEEIRKTAVTSSRVQNEVDTDNIIPNRLRTRHQRKGFALFTPYRDPIPKNYADCHSRPDTTKWIDCTQAEYNSLMDNNIGDLVSLPHGKRAISCKWVYKIKYNQFHEIVKYKARLTARGFTQQKGLDYSETYAPVATQNSLRIVLSLAAAHDWEIHQGDISTAFLLASLDDEFDLYMEQPEGFIKPGTEHLVFKLKKSIYGLKQAPRLWNKEIDSYLTSIGLTPSKEDQCIYTKRNKHGKVIFILLLYVDDTLFLGPMQEVNRYKNLLAVKYPFTDLGEAKYILGMEIERDRKSKTIILHQHAYIANLLTDTKMELCKPSPTPADCAIRLSNEMSPTNESDKKIMDNIPYRSTVCSLQWLAQNTRPDIAVAVNTCARFMINPGAQHWNAVKRILRYLKGTSKMGITLGGSEMELQLYGYSDADWGGDPDTRRSTTGYMFMLGSYPISWKSKLQPTTALSSMEAELISISAANQEALWIRKFLDSIGVPQLSATLIHEDNQACIKYVYGNQLKTRAKHIGIRYYFIKDSIARQETSVKYCPTGDMRADMLTKPLQPNVFKRHVHAIGMSNSSSSPVTHLSGSVKG